MNTHSARLLNTGVALAVAGLLLACASNIETIQPAAAPVANHQTFTAPLDKVWSATQRFLSEDHTFKVLDKSSGIMVTEMRPIDGKELSLVQTYFLGKTYKHGYTINLAPSGGVTTVRVNVKLQATQVVLLSREESNPQVEGYLRAKLFDGIAANLR
jgi:hypothetical protein